MTAMSKQDRVNLGMGMLPAIRLAPFVVNSGPQSPRVDVTRYFTE
jgi:hypothetical protein